MIEEEPYPLRRRRSINSILKESTYLDDNINVVHNVYELINVLEEKKINMSLNEFIIMLRDNIYTKLKLIYYESFKSNAVKNSYNPYHEKSYSTYCNYYLYFLNYAYYYFSRIYKNPENEIDKKITTYEHSRNIKKQIDIFIEILDQEHDNSL